MSAGAPGFAMIAKSRMRHIRHDRMTLSVTAT
jgi:hypothetical protein